MSRLAERSTPDQFVSGVETEMLQAGYARRETTTWIRSGPHAFNLATGLASIPQQTFRFSLARCRVLLCAQLDQTMTVHYGKKKAVSIAFS